MMNKSPDKLHAHVDDQLLFCLTQNKNLSVKMAAIVEYNKVNRRTNPNDSNALSKFDSSKILGFSFINEEE